MKICKNVVGCAVGAFAMAGTLMSAASSAQASVIFEQAPNYGGALYADSQGVAASQRIAENFIPDFSASIEQVTWWGSNNDNVHVNAFTIKFYEDNGGMPGAHLYTESPSSVASVDTGIDMFGNDVYQYSVVLNLPVSVDGGTQYWFSVTNATSVSGTWGWTSGDSADVSLAGSSDHGETWWSTFGGVSMRLEGTVVPAPASLGLAGLAGVAAMRRRRR
jgi:MYXO-CTERM domain-containing protein